MRDLLTITKALADAQRLRALLALARRELCVCQLIELLALAPSTVSKHMAILERARLVDCRKEGRWVYYRLPEKPESTCVAEALQWLRKCLRKDEQIARDAGKLRDILKLDKAELCVRRKRR
ncbi:MAG: metalloregulator ArsR/SmtB family transcription factor [Planctomycetota bacterium]